MAGRSVADQASGLPRNTGTGGATSPVATRPGSHYAATGMCPRCYRETSLDAQGLPKVHPACVPAPVPAPRHFAPEGLVWLL